MKLITLNTWGGRAGKEGLLQFFAEHRNIDIFCLQEIWSAPYEHLEGQLAGGLRIDNSRVMTYGMQEISGLLADEFNAFFNPNHGDHYGLMMLVRKNLNVVAKGEVFVYKEKGYVETWDVGDHARNIQYLTLNINDQPLTVMNFHGLWNGKGKIDSEDRIDQSKKIVDFLKSLNGDCVFAGDFNLLPDTESMKIIESAGLKNLVRNYGITSTRTSIYKKPEKHASYVLVSDNIEVKDFRVLPDEVSDHSPLFLDFELK